MESLRKILKVDGVTEVYAATGLHINVFMYALSFWLTQPLLPYMTKELGADRVTFGYLQTCLEVAQVFSSLYFGQVIDKVGSRYAMALAQFGSGISYLLLATAPSVNFLFLSRVPTVFMAVMLCAQGTMPSLTNGKDRAGAIGRLSVSYLLGMIIGSICGGILSDEYGYDMVGYLAMTISLLMAFLTLVVFPNTNIIRVFEKTDTKINMFSAISMSFRKHIRHLVVVILVCGMALSLYKSQFSVIMADHFHIKAKQAGLTTAIAAAVGIICNTFLVAPLRNHFSSRTLIVYSTLGLAVCFVLLTLVDNFEQLIALIVPITFASTILYTVGAAALSNSVSMDETGTAVSISHSVRSLTGVIAPFVGGYLFQNYNIDGIGFISALLATASGLLFIVMSPQAPNHIAKVDTTTSDKPKIEDKGEVKKEEKKKKQKQN
eukprot:m.6688 g.6688  ORF g.6688 m.6688 type:complete len:434 (+) comp2634_c0_seq1:54-1355(+)